MRLAQTRAHRTGSLTLVGVLACALVLFMPYGPAEAAVPPGVDWDSFIVNSPSSKLYWDGPSDVVDRKASADLNAANRNFNRANPTPGVAVKTPGKLGKVGAAAKGVSGAYIGTVGGWYLLNGTYDVATSALDFASFGLVDGYDEATSLGCDLGSVFGAGCLWGASVEYTVNGDLAFAEPGWSPTNVYQFGGGTVTSSQHTYTSGIYTVSIGTDAQYGDTSVALTFTQSVEGTCEEAGSNSYYAAPFQRFRLVGYSFSTGEVGNANVNLFNPANSMVGRCTGNYTTVEFTSTYNMPNGYGFAYLDSLGDARGSYFWGDAARNGYMVPEVPPVWYPEGNPDRPDVAEENPERRWLTTYRCVGGTDQTATSEPWREADPEWPLPPEPACSEGLLEYVKVEQLTVGGPTTLIYEWALPSEGGGVTSIPDEYPECVDGSCLLELWRVSEGTQLNCFSNPSLCLDWYTTGQLDQYRCTYGGTQIDIQECKVYATVFTGTPTLADPATGERVTTSGGATPAPIETPGYNTDCPPAFSWTSLFNPWYYYKGVSCALSEAFVPTQTAIKVQALQTKLSTRAPVTQINSVITWLDPGTMAGSCGSFGIPIWFLDQTLTAFDTCNPDDPLMKAMSPYRLVIGAAVWISIVAPLAWWAWREYAPGSKGVA